MARRQARLQIVAAADTGADDERDLLAGIEILGRGRGRSRTAEHQYGSGHRADTPSDGLQVDCHLHFLVDDLRECRES